ncbi:MAG: fumarylacetoacetase [Phycisphaerales bacterium]|nr:fumarylacetoacetase [Phycisphaerales bacterium]
MPTDATHDPSLKSWVESANDPQTAFPIQNLPLCSFEQEHDGHSHPHLGVVIGDRVLDVTTLAMSGKLCGGDEQLARVLHAPLWNIVAGQPGLVRQLRAEIQDFLRSDRPASQPIKRLRDKALVPLAEARLRKPLLSFDYTDFYASKHHATTVGSMFRPDNPLLPNYTHVPIGYHGRASSIVPSGTPIRRPSGQTKADDAALPAFGPSKMLDYEMELGVFIASGNTLGEPIRIGDVREHMLGMCIVNDWSARDLQKWEYQPLGPFLAKNFATSVSPFIVTMEALEPFRIPGPARGEGDPEPLGYLQTSEPWGLDVAVEVHLATKQMRDKGMSPMRLSRGSFRDMYWTIAQLITHHASNGCNLQTGDLLGSGTISGPTKDARGCLLELTWEGVGPDGKPKPRAPIQLPTGETRLFLQDGDEVIMNAFCERDGFRRIGFGECRGVIVG